MYLIWKLKKGWISDVYKVKITEQDENSEGKWDSRAILAPLCALDYVWVQQEKSIWTEIGSF